MMTHVEVQEVQDLLLAEQGAGAIINWWYLEGYRDVLRNLEDYYPNGNNSSDLHVQYYKLGRADAEGDLSND